MMGTHLKNAGTVQSYHPEFLRVHFLYFSKEVQNWTRIASEKSKIVTINTWKARILVLFKVIYRLHKKTTIKPKTSIKRGWKGPKLGCNCARHSPKLYQKYIIFIFYIPADIKIRLNSWLFEYILKDNYQQHMNCLICMGFSPNGCSINNQST